MSTSYEHKGAIPGIEYGALCPIDRLGGKQLAPTQGLETKSSYEELLTDARRRVAAGDQDDAADDEDGEEDDVITETPLPTVGPDEQVVMEAPLESLTEDTRKQVLAAQLVAEARLPAPGPPRGLKVQFCVPYLKSTAEAYEGISGRPVRTLVVGTGWAGHFNPNNGETWVDVGRHSGELIRHTLHELTHAWRRRTPAFATMTATQMEDEAWAWADELLPEVLTLLNTPQEVW